MFSSSTGPIVGGDGRVGAGPASGGTSVKSSGDWSTSRSAAARLRLVASPPPLRLRRRFVFTPSPSARVHNTPGVEDEPVPPPSRSESSLRDHNTPSASGRAGWKLLVFCRHLVQGSRLFHRRCLHLHASVAFIGVTCFALHGIRTDDLAIVRRVTALAVRLRRLVNVDEGAGHQRRDEDVGPGSEPSVGVF